MPVTVLPATKNARADVITSQLGIGASLNIYTASYAALLASFTWTGDVFAPAVGGVLSMNAPDVNPIYPIADGFASIARLTKADGVTHIISDLTVGTVGEVIVSSIDFVTTTPITLNGIIITEA